MPAAARKAAISFGMVYIPVSLYTAVQEKGISFNQLTKDGVRIRQKKVREESPLLTVRQILRPCRHVPC